MEAVEYRSESALNSGLHVFVCSLCAVDLKSNQDVMSSYRFAAFQQLCYGSADEGTDF
ncbi:hypothetical protein J3D56_001348 [Erwinia persicina]|nr:hypothetical protein [Erwinia persicina]